jgi:hypothetical protein
MGYYVGYQLQAGAKDPSIPHIVQTGSGAHPASSAMKTWGSFTRDKGPEAPTNTEAKETLIHISTSPYVLVECYLIN